MAMTKLTGKKVKMTQLFKDEKVVPVSLVKLESGDFAGLEAGAKVMVSAVSKSKGFEGVVKRHGFHGGPQTHGQKNRLRAPGSIGNTALQRVRLGRRMAGRMGGVRITVKGLKVVEVDKENKTLFLRGALPGNNGSKVEIYYES